MNRLDTDRGAHGERELNGGHFEVDDEGCRINIEFGMITFGVMLEQEKLVRRLRVEWKQVGQQLDVEDGAMNDAD